MKNYLLFLIFIDICCQGMAQEMKLVIPTGHTADIRCIDVSDDGKLIATGSTDNSIIIWDTRTWKQLRTIDLKQPVLKVFFAHDAKSLLAAYGGEMRGMYGLNFSIWDAGNGKLISELPFSGSIGFRLSPDGKLMAVPYFADKQSVASANPFVPDKSNNLSGSTALWDLTQHKKTVLPTTSIIGPQLNYMQAGEFIHFKDSVYFLKTDLDILKSVSIISLLDIHQAERKITGKDTVTSAIAVKSFTNTGKGMITSIVASPAGTLFATNSSREPVRVWSLEKDQPLGDFQPEGKAIRKIAFSADGKSLLVYSTSEQKSYLNTWELANPSGKAVYALPDGMSKNEVTISPRGDFLVISDKNIAHVFDLRGNAIALLTGHTAGFNEYVFSSNGRFVNIGQHGRIPTVSANGGSFEDLKKYAIQNAIKMNERTLGRELTGKERDSVYNAMLARFERSKKTADSLSQGRIWDLEYGTALSAVPDLVKFTQDSISPDKKYTLTAPYKPSGLNGVASLVKNNPFIDKAIQSKDAGIDFKKTYDTSGIMYKMVSDQNSAYNRMNTDITMLINNHTKDTLYLFALDSTDWMITSPDGYYMSSKNGAGLLYYTLNNDIISFEQLDLKNNRPDKILERIGYADKSLIEAYRNAYLKRIKTLHIDTTYFRESNSVPKAAIVNREQTRYIQKSEQLSLHFNCTEARGKLVRFNLWVNYVPLFGSAGIELAGRNIKSFDTSIDIVLSAGENRIETSVLNSYGTESYKSPLIVKYEPAKAKSVNVYFVGIGISRFADPSHNLWYCEKDIRDLAFKLKEKYGASLKIDTLFNENVTAEKISALKQKLLAGNENDKVIVAYSGHGLFGTNNDYFLSTYDINFKEPVEHGLPYEEFEKLVDGIKARDKLMMIDACHSGELDTDESQSNAPAINLLRSKNKLGLKNSFELMQELFVKVGRNTGTTILAAAEGTQAALERKELANGLFTYSILELFKPGKTVTVNQLKKYVSNRVSELTLGKQRPVARSETPGLDWQVW